MATRRALRAAGAAGDGSAPPPGRRVRSSGSMPVHPVLDPGIVWVRRDCVRWGDRGPYHWTAECIEGRALVELDRVEAEAMRNLRPCKLCMSRDRRLRGRATPARCVRRS
jgi:hypothetical protein